MLQKQEKFNSYNWQKSLNRKKKSTQSKHSPLQPTAGALLLMSGIIFCWIVPNIRKSRRRSGDDGPTIEEILEAGFNTGGHTNPLDVLADEDRPPDYACFSRYPAVVEVSRIGTAVKRSDDPPPYKEHMFNGAAVTGSDDTIIKRWRKVAAGLNVSQGTSEKENHAIDEIVVSYDLTSSST